MVNLLDSFVLDHDVLGEKKPMCDMKNTSLTLPRDIGLIANGEEKIIEIVITGAALGDFVLASLSTGIIGLQLSASVTSPNTISCVLLNNTSEIINLGNITIYIRLIKR